MADDASFTLRYPKRLERRLFGDGELFLPKWKSVLRQAPWCMKCKDAIWHLDGKQVVAAFSSLDGKVVELVVEGSGVKYYGLV